MLRRRPLRTFRKSRVIQQNRSCLMIHESQPNRTFLK
jgi:hypothetical protein